MNVSSRHEGDLAGKLRAFDPNLAISIRVVVQPNAAHLASAQMTAGFFVNLISRLDGVASGIELICPDKVPLATQLSPLIDTVSDLKSALHAINREIGVVPIAAAKSSPRVISIGETSSEEVDLYVLGAGWCGGARTTSFNLSDSNLPFGPYIAACIGTAEFFKWARMDPQPNGFSGGAFLSAWSYQVQPEPFQDGPASLPSIALSGALAGVGAVGSAYLHTIWALPEILGNIDAYDNDLKGVEDSNLNRYAFFGQSDLGKQKASCAAEKFTHNAIRLLPHDSDIAFLSSLPDLILSAVDTNRARSKIQNLYPTYLLSASTQDLRAEVLSAGPPGVGACLRCYNPPESSTPDAEHFDRLLKNEALVSEIADELGESLDTIKETAIKRSCSTTGDRILAHLKRVEGEPFQFAVSFVSALAGVFLAAEHVKFELAEAPRMNSERQWFVFQFVRPTADTNGIDFLARDELCPLCAPGDFGTLHWEAKLTEIAL